MKTNKNPAAYKFRIGNKIRKWRNIKDIKQKDLAYALGVSEASVSNIENDVTNITLGQLEEISIALDVPMDQLLSDPEDKIRFNGTPSMVSEAQAQYFADKELLSALIESLEKKDQQLQVIMQNFLHAISSLTKQEKIIFNGSQQLSSRA